MSERSGGGSGVGPFLLGAAIGAALGYLFAPAPGTETRRKLSRRLQDLKELASEEADELRSLVAGEEGEAGDEDAVEQPERSAREELERRLATARRRRRERAEGGAAAGQLTPEEDEPVA
jgi:gas vesicle protein